LDELDAVALDAVAFTVVNLIVVDFAAEALVVVDFAAKALVVVDLDAEALVVQLRPCLVSRRVSALDRIAGKRMFGASDAFSHQARPPLSEPSSQTGRIYQEISYDPAID
jgi:hypothetical protein